MNKDYQIFTLHTRLTEEYNESGNENKKPDNVLLSRGRKKTNKTV